MWSVSEFFWPLACYFNQTGRKGKKISIFSLFWCYVCTYLCTFSKMFQYIFLFCWPHYFRGDWTLNRFWIQGWKVVLNSITTTWEPKLHEKLANWFLKAFWQPSSRALSKSYWLIFCGSKLDFEFGQYLCQMRVVGKRILIWHAY